MFLRNNSDYSSIEPYGTNQIPSRSSNKLLRAIRRQRNTLPAAPSPLSSCSSKIPWLKPPSRALVVGINEYQAEKITNLNGCLEDANRMVYFLTEELGMERDDIILLTSPMLESSLLATRAAILDGLCSTLNETPAGEEALFYYSGHGSTCAVAPEINCDSQNGTLVPMDARQNGVLDILNQELRYLIAESIEQRGVRFTMIADSCHSGSLLRDGWRARFTAPNEPARTLDTLLDGTVDYERLAELYQQRTLPYTLLAGCLPHQSSYEIKQDGKVQGLMTSSLLEVLKNVNSRLTYQELGRLIRAVIPQHPQGKSQYPNIVGVEDRLIFGSEEIVRPQALFVVQKVFNDNTIRIETSKPNQLLEGCILTTYTDFTFTKKVAQWEVIKNPHNNNGLTTIIATKMWGEDAKPGTPLLLDRTKSRRFVYFDPNASAVASAWRNRQPPKWLYLHEIPINDADVIVKAALDQWVVQQPDGQILMRQPQTPAGTQQIAELIDQVVAYKEFEALLSEPSFDVDAQPRVNLKADLLDYAQKKQISLAVGPQKLEPFPYWKEVQICLTLSNPTLQTLYIYPYLLDSERYEARTLLSAQEEAELAAGDSRTIFYPVDHDTLSLQLKLLVSRYPLVLELSPNENNFSGPAFRVSATLPLLPHLSDWDIQSLVISYDKEAPVRTLDSAKAGLFSLPRSEKTRKPKKEVIDYGSQAENSEQVSPPSLFFESNASELASLWRQTDLKCVRRMLYLSETRDRYAADYIIKAEGNDWVTTRQGGGEIQALRRELALGREVVELIDQVACYEQFEALAPTSTDRLPMPLFGEEAGVKLTAQLIDKKEYVPLAVGVEKLAPLPAGTYHARLIVKNQSQKILYVYLYRLEPHRHLAQRLWPSDGSAQLPADKWGSLYLKVEHKILNESTLPLKLLVSSEPLVMEEWPCGRKGTDERSTHRGIKMNQIRSLKPRMVGWGVQQLLLSSER